VQRAAHAKVEPLHGRRLVEVERLVSDLHEALPGAEVTRVVAGTCLVNSLVDAVPASVIGRSDVQDADIDRVLAARIAVGVGDRIQIVSPRQRLTPLGPLPVRLQLEIARIVAPVPGGEGGTVTLPLGSAQRLLWGEGVVEALELRDSPGPWQVGDRAERALVSAGHEVRVTSLEELHRPLLLALTLERFLIFTAVGLMLVVASLNLLCNVAMVAAEKRQDMAVLASLGMAPGSLRRVFLTLGFGIGLTGTLLGTAAGVLISFVLDATQALPLPRGVFVVSSVPFRAQPEAVISVLVLALVLTIVASWLPARAVSKREPAEGLRYE
jgi:lipoprotein-releasing system permease protein